MVERDKVHRFKRCPNCGSTAIWQQIKTLEIGDKGDVVVLLDIAYCDHCNVISKLDYSVSGEVM